MESLLPALMLGGFVAIAVITGLLELAWRRGRIPLGRVLSVGFGCAAVFSVAMCALLWASGGESWLIGAAVGGGSFLAMLAVAEVVWRLSGRSIIGEMVTGRQP